MSGGSYDYLCDAFDLSDLADKRHQLEAMAERLAGLPWARVPAFETRRLLDAIDRLSIRVEAAKELRKVWHAVEWWDSCDWGEDQVREAVRAYEDADVVA